MTDQSAPQGGDATDPRTTSDHAYGPPSFPPPAYPPPGIPAPSAQGAPTRRPRAGRSRMVFAATVVAASLVVGGAAGVGGAAAWSAVDGDASDGASSTDSSQTSLRVADTAEVPAAKGSVEDVASSVLPSVVELDVTGGQQGGSGSGIVLDEKGLILTNDHVVTLAGSVDPDDATIVVSFDDGTRADATVVGVDPLTDTALVQAEDVSGLTPATIGDSDDLDVGEDVVAIGSPFGLDATVTSGIVSALDRAVDVGTDDQGNSTTYPAIQTDAAINPGNSGGPLVDDQGHVIGINSSIRSTGGESGESGSIGLGFAIPINEVLPIIEQMKNGETPTHAQLGVQVSDVSAQAQGGAQGAEVTEGAQVQEVGDGSAAGDAGLQQGDVITGIDDQQISGADSLVATIRSYRPGDTVEVTYLRDGQEETASLQLASDGGASS